MVKLSLLSENLFDCENIIEEFVQILIENIEKIEDKSKIMYDIIFPATLISKKRIF